MGCAVGRLPAHGRNSDMYNLRVRPVELLAFLWYTNPIRNGKDGCFYDTYLSTAGGLAGGGAAAGGAGRLRRSACSGFVRSFGASRHDNDHRCRCPHDHHTGSSRAGGTGVVVVGAAAAVVVVVAGGAEGADESGAGAPPQPPSAASSSATASQPASRREVCVIETAILSVAYGVSIP